MTDETIARRRFLLGAGAAGTAVALAPGLAAPAAAQSAQAPIPPAAAAAPPPAEPPPLTLNATEVAFFTAVADTMIPADDLSPSGSACGVVTFIDRQLASAWGGGAKLYRSGPFLKGKPEQGYQLGLTPREYFAAGVVATNAWVRKTHGKDFDRLAEADRVAALKELEDGKAELPDFAAKPFFEQLLNIVMEGFFADPIYGGNRDKAAWKMVGFPGLPALYADKIEEYRGKPYAPPPQSIADFS